MSSSVSDIMLKELVLKLTIKQRLKVLEYIQEVSPELMTINDPNDLLMDIAMKIVNKQRYDLMKEGIIPSNTWGGVLLNVLDKTKRLETTTKSDLQTKLKQYTSTELLDLRKRLIES